jgi:pyruvate formate lyase activating enzyme
MKLAGLEKTSLLDYPDQISAVVFTQGCNFYCPYCHNSQLITIESAPNSIMPETYFFDFLEQRQNLLDAVTITGGEPCLQPDLKEFIIKIKQNYDLKLKLDSNGSNAAVIKDLLEEKLLDYIAIDVKASLDNYSWLAPAELGLELEKTINLVLNSGIDYEFRTTVVPALHDSKEIKKIAELIRGANSYYLQNFRSSTNVLAAELRKQRSFTEQELLEFKEIAVSYVKKVIIRD